MAEKEEVRIMFKTFTSYIIFVTLLLLFSASCNQVDTVQPVQPETIAPEEASEGELFTDDDVDNSLLELASSTISVLGNEGEEILDGEEVDLTLYEPTETELTTEYLKGAKGKGCFIVFNPNASKPWEIRMVNLRFKRLQIIYKSRAELNSVGCTSNGRVIVFSRRQTKNASSDFELYKYDGNKVVRLTDNDVDDLRVTINFDCTIIVWESDKKVHYREYSAPKTFEEFFLDHSKPQIEPSLGCGGLCIVLVRVSGKRYSIKMYSIGTNDYTNIFGRDVRLRDPSTDLGGKKVVFVQGDGLVRIKEGKKLINVIGNKKIKSSPSISDDCKWVLIVISDELWLIDLEKGSKKRITGASAALQAEGQLTTQMNGLGKLIRTTLAGLPIARLEVEKFFIDENGNSLGTSIFIPFKGTVQMRVQAKNIGSKPAYNLFVRDFPLFAPDAPDAPNGYSISKLPNETESTQGGDGFQTTKPFDTLEPGETHKWDFEVTVTKKGTYCDLADVKFVHNKAEDVKKSSDKVSLRGTACLRVVEPELKVKKYFVKIDDENNILGTEHTIPIDGKAKLVIKATNTGKVPLHRAFVKDRLSSATSPNSYTILELPDETDSLTKNSGFISNKTIPKIEAGGSFKWTFVVTASKKGKYCDLAKIGYAPTLESNGEFHEGDFSKACLFVEGPDPVIKFLNEVGELLSAEAFAFARRLFGNSFKTSFHDPSNPNVVYIPTTSPESGLRLYEVDFTDLSNPVKKLIYDSPNSCSSGVRSIIYRRINPFSGPSYDAVIVFSFDQRSLCIIPLGDDGFVTIGGTDGAPTGVAPLSGSETDYAYVDFENSKLVVVQNGVIPDVEIPLSGDENSCPFNITIIGTMAYVVGQEGSDTCNNHRGLFKVDLVNGVVVKELNFGTQPRGIAFSEDKIYVADFAENVIYVIDATTMTEDRTIPVGSGPVGVTINSDGKYLLTTNWNDNKVQVIDGCVLHTVED